MPKKVDANQKVKTMTVEEYKALAKKKPSKYRNIKTVTDGKTFDSLKGSLICNICNLKIKNKEPNPP